MRRLAWILIVLVAIPSAAQSYPEVEALLDMIFARDPATVLRHLPKALEQQLATLPPNDQLDFARNLMFADRLGAEGLSITRSDDGRSLIHVSEKSTDLTAEVTLEKRISDGYEALLRLHFNSNEEHTLSESRLQVWMRFEDGEWRVLEIQSADSGPDLMNFEDPKAVARFRSRHLPANESAALATIRTYNTAFVTYSAVYSDQGFPPNLEVLGGAGTPDDTDAQHAGLVDSLLSTRPFEKNGYRFEYRPDTSQYPRQTYILIARPTAHGVTGRRSFYTDQSASVHFTEEDRDPTPDDPLIE
jgi:hypothetical protein